LSGGVKTVPGVSQGKGLNACTRTAPAGVNEALPLAPVILKSVRHPPGGEGRPAKLKTLYFRQLFFVQPRSN
jgi:hypothetical protein